MVELQLSFRCSQFFATTASVKVESAAALALLLSAARLLAQVALHPIH